MKNQIIFGIMVVAVGWLAPQIATAQETTYLSNLGQTSAGNLAVGSDSWMAASFYTGNNADGYLLNSVQLSMTDASGAPSGFTVMIYESAQTGPLPIASLGTLSGSPDPSGAGIYTYTPASQLMLSSFSPYLIVVTAGTAVANGSYEWSFANTFAYNPSPYWDGGALVDSNDGSHWNVIPNTFPQYALSATAVPEPDVSGLLVLCGLGLLRQRRKTKAA